MKLRQANPFSSELLHKEICSVWFGFWCLVFLSPTCLLLLSSHDGNPVAKMKHANIINLKQFSESQILRSMCVFRENQNSNSAILRSALGMGGTVSLTVTDVSEDWRVNI